MNVGLIDAVKSTAGQLYNAVNSALPSSKLPKDCLPQSSKSCTPDDMKLINAELGLSEEHFSSLEASSALRMLSYIITLRQWLYVRILKQCSGHT